MRYDVARICQHIIGREEDDHVVSTGQCHSPKSQKEYCLFGGVFCRLTDLTKVVASTISGFNSPLPKHSRLPSPHHTTFLKESRLQKSSADHSEIASEYSEWCRCNPTANVYILYFFHSWLPQFFKRVLSCNCYHLISSWSYFYILNSQKNLCLLSFRCCSVFCSVSGVYYFSVQFHVFSARVSF